MGGLELGAGDRPLGADFDGQVSTGGFRLFRTDPGCRGGVFTIYINDCQEESLV